MARAVCSICQKEEADHPSGGACETCVGALWRIKGLSASPTGKTFWGVIAEYLKHNRKPIWTDDNGMIWRYHDYRNHPEVMKLLPKGGSRTSSSKPALVINQWNTTCHKCNSPAYIGLTLTECSDPNCKEEDNG